MGPLTIPGGTSSSFLPSLVSSLLLLLLEDPVALPELEEDVLDDKSTGWFTMLLLFTFEVVDGGDEEGSFFTPCMRLVFDWDWIWDAATIFLRFDNELLTKRLDDGDDDSEDDLGDNG